MQQPKTDSVDAPALFTFVGTAFLAYLLALGRALPYGVYLVFDSATELAKLNLKGDAHHVFMMVPADDLPAHSLVKLEGEKHLQDAMNAIPNFSTESGMGQVRAVGYCSIRHLLRTIDFEKRFHTQVLTSLREMSGGEISKVTHNHFCGLSGGTGSAGGLELLKEVHRQHSRHSSLEIESVVHGLGALTFSSPAFTRTTENAGAALVELLAYTRQLLPGRVSTVLSLFELPPRGTNGDERDRILIEKIQAEKAPRVVLDEKRDRSNKQSDGDVGGIQLNRSLHMQRLQPSRVSANVATNYSRHLRRIVAAKGDPESIDVLEFRSNHHPANRPSLDKLLEEVLVTTPDELIEQTTNHPCEYRYETSIRLATGRTLHLSDVRSEFQEPLRSVKSAEARMTLLLSCNTACVAEIELLSMELEELAIDLDWLAHDAEMAIRNIQQGWWGWLRSCCHPFESRLNELQDALDDLRAESDEIQSVEAKVVALSETQNQLEREVFSLTNKIRFLLEEFIKLQPRGDERVTARWVEPLPVDLEFSGLLEHAESPEPGKLMQLLCNCVASVTVEGLAEIADSDPSIESVLRNVLSGECVADTCPHWGGETSRLPAKQCFVFPPVEDRLRQQIEDQAKTSNTTVAFATTACESINIVLLETVYALESSDVITPYYEASIRSVIDTPSRPFFVCDQSAFQSMGYLPAPSTTPSKRSSK